MIHTRIKTVIVNHEAVNCCVIWTELSFCISVTVPPPLTPSALTSSRLLSFGVFSDVWYVVFLLTESVYCMCIGFCFKVSCLGSGSNVTCVYIV